MSNPTLSRAVEGYLLHKSASGRSKYTIRNYRNQLGRFCSQLDDCPIDKVSPQDIELFLEWLRMEYRYTKVGTLAIDPRPLSAKTIRNAWAALSNFWNWSSREFNIKNPFDIPSPKAPHTPVTPLTMEEVDLLLRACARAVNNSKRSTAKRDKAILLAFLDTGVRVSELCQADISNLDLESGRLFVTGKGNKSRYVYLGKVTRQALWTYLAERYPDKEPDNSESIFTNSRGFGRLSRHNVRNLLSRIGNRAGVDKVHPHRFRHTFAIEFLRNGGDVFSLQQLLGHSSLEMVRKYLQIAEMDLERTHRKASPADNWRLR